VRYIKSIPPPIRSLSLGILINRTGGYVTAFLALILSLRHASALQISFALILSAAFAIAGSWCGGISAARFGARRTIVLAMMGSAVFTALLVFGGPFAVTTALVCCIAFFNRGFQPAAATIIGRASRGSERVTVFAFYQSAYNIGAAVGPVIGTFLLTRSLTALFLVDAGTSAAYALMALRIPLSVSSRAPATAQPEDSKRAIDRRYLLFCLSVIIVAVVYSQSSGALPLSFRSHHYSLQALGLLLSANAIAVIVLALPISRVIRKWPPWLPLTIGAVLICGGYALLLTGFTLPVLAVNTACWTLGEMLVLPVRPVVAVLMSTEASHASYQGALTTAQTIGQVIGPSAGVLAYSFGAAVPWAMCAVLLGPATALSWLLLRTVRPSPAGRPDAQVR
jgi:predicted MFS family arabinose efflux permease